MPINLSLQHNTGFTISPERMQRIESVALNEADYCDEVAVQKARAEIVHMGAWDTFVDRVFCSGSKQRALNAIATIILSAKADASNARNRVEELCPDSVHDAKYELVTLLSSDGARDFASAWKDTGEGIRFFPPTGDSELCGLLGNSVFPYGLAAILWEKADMHELAAKAWDKAAEAWQKDEVATLLGNEDVVQEIESRAKAQWALARGHAAQTIEPDTQTDPNSLRSIAVDAKEDKMLADDCEVIVSSQDSVDRELRTVGSLTPSEYMAEVNSGLPMIKSLDINSRLEPLQQMLARLHGLTDADRATAFAAVHAAAADLPEKSRLELLGSLYRNIGALARADQEYAWDDCFRAIRDTNGVVKTGMAPALIPLGQSLRAVSDVNHRLVSFSQMVSSMSALDPKDPDKEAVLLELASLVPRLIPKVEVPNLARIMYAVADRVGDGRSCRMRLQEKLDGFYNAIPSTMR